MRVRLHFTHVPQQVLTVCVPDGTGQRPRTIIIITLLYSRIFTNLLINHALWIKKMKPSVNTTLRAPFNVPENACVAAINAANPAISRNANEFNGAGRRADEAVPESN